MKPVTKDQEQAAFEDWLSDNCPSGDVDSVQWQWEASHEYEDLYAPTTIGTAQAPCHARAAVAKATGGAA